MEGKYYNPHALQPGEDLSPAQLLERYLDWHYYHLHVAQIWKTTDMCDPGKRNQNLCCADHMRFQEEYNVFFRYFRFLKMIEDREEGFSIYELAQVILKFNIAITPVLKDKLSRHWGRDAYLGFRQLGI